MKPNPVPDGYRSITPYLKLPNYERLLEFLKTAFGAIAKNRLTRPDGTLLHAKVLIGDSLVMVHEASPDWNCKPSTLYLYIADVDATYRDAIAAGGTSIFAPADMYYGDRAACVADVSGNDWWIATRLENATIAELQNRAEAFLNERSVHTA